MEEEGAGEERTWEVVGTRRRQGFAANATSDSASAVVSDRIKWNTAHQCTNTASILQFTR